MSEVGGPSRSVPSSFSSPSLRLWVLTSSSLSPSHPMPSEPIRRQSLPDLMRAVVRPAASYSNVIQFKQDIVTQLDNLAQRRHPRYRWPAVKRWSPSTVKNRRAWQLPHELYDNGDGGIHLATAPASIASVAPANFASQAPLVTLITPVAPVNFASLVSPPTALVNFTFTVPSASSVCSIASILSGNSALPPVSSVTSIPPAPQERSLFSTGLTLPPVSSVA